MKRIHLFEFEDFSWFPNWLREHMTPYIVVVHKLLGSTALLTPLVERALRQSKSTAILDLCSGAGGAMPEVLRQLRAKDGLHDLKLTLSDLFPNQTAAEGFARSGEPGITYRRDSVDVTDVTAPAGTLRTMVCSMHHMPPSVARKILEDAFEKRQPLCVFEISDNSPPLWLWWTAIPVNFLMVLLLTPFVRPFSWRQLFFTYVIPLLPFFIAWDGAVSNARTYTASDTKELLVGLDAPDYTWEYGSLRKPGYPGGMAYILGLPRVS